MVCGFGDLVGGFVVWVGIRQRFWWFEFPG